MGLIFSASILLISSKPRGNAIQINPVPTQGPIRVYIVGAVKESWSIFTPET